MSLCEFHKKMSKKTGFAFSQSSPIHSAKIQLRTAIAIEKAHR